MGFPVLAMLARAVGLHWGYHCDYLKQEQLRKYVGKVYINQE